MDHDQGQGCDPSRTSCQASSQVANQLKLRASCPFSARKFTPSQECSGFGDGRVADVFIRDPFATQPNSPSPSPVSCPRPRDDAAAPTFAPCSVQGRPPAGAAQRTTRTRTVVVRDLEAPGAEHDRAASVAVLGARNGRATSHQLGRRVGGGIWLDSGICPGWVGSHPAPWPEFQFLAPFFKSLFRKGSEGSKGSFQKPGQKTGNLVVHVHSWGAGFTGIPPGAVARIPVSCPFFQESL